ncbi:MAG: tRNA (N(6)-L-threonylcarbamoyladenosine(37)-C(2))-methylthiotransferase MtaB [Phycisphaerae bacterium]|nr:tRNA (N(6)-L-threonylcarbamoyladenosine(37)-C(2))-methylthiotransferase MtaB [Phycisphaerae bacterium]
MKTFSINTLGCKVNQYESQQIRELLEKLGLQQAESPEQSDLVVVNTCCVTHRASAKSRQHIRRAGKLNPDAAVVVSGCLPIVQIGELNVAGNNIHLIRNRTDLGATIAHATGLIAAPAVSQRARSYSANTIKAKIDHKSKKEIIADCRLPIADSLVQIENRKSKIEDDPALPTLTSFQGQTRAFLKVQDGCDGYCTYCIVPRARSIVHSKPLARALAEAQTLVEAGHREIVVTGIFLGAYGQDTVRRQNWPAQSRRAGNNLADLLDKMANLPGMGRIRLSSLEPADVTPRLLDTLCKHPNIMPHLHLPLQSGSDDILRKMCRQYRVAQFKETIDLLKARLDRPAITTDIIVGFPCEGEADFDQTVDLAKDAGFAKMHIFSFSPRRGTAAAEMQGAVDNKVIRERSEILHALDIELAMKYRQQFIGETAQVLLETNDPGAPGNGRSERYFRVALKNSRKKVKDSLLIKVRLLENHKDGMIGAPE